MGYVANLRSRGAEGSCSGETSSLGSSWLAGAACHWWDRGRGEEGENASPTLLDFASDSDLGLARCLPSGRTASVLLREKAGQ